MTLPQTSTPVFSRKAREILNGTIQPLVVIIFAMIGILVIEAGPDNRGVENIENPIFYLDHLLPTSNTAHFYKANKAEQLAGRECIVPAGGVLGGGSSINFMMYTRAQRHDLDSFGQPGWNSKELLPYLKKV